MVRLRLELTTVPGESWRLVDALRSLTVPTREEHGCLGSQLLLSSASSEPSTIRYVEEWPTEGELREQVRSERFLRLLGLMEAALEPAHISFDLPGGTRGLDYVAEVRRDLFRKWPQPSSPGEDG